MKTLSHQLLFPCTLFAILSCQVMIVTAQVPQFIPYQAAARDNSGNVISNQNISLRFTIHDATANGTAVYKETQGATTTSLGLFTVNIGQGSPVTGTFSSINWSTNSKFLQVEMDATGGTGYIDMGTTQMLSVPYALYAASSGNSSGDDWTLSGTDIYNNNTGNVGIGVASPSAKLDVDGNLRIHTLTSGYVKSDASGNLSNSTTVAGSDVNGNIAGNAANVTGTVAAANGGTGQSSYSTGDILFASSTTTLSKLADAATGNALLSGGVGGAPSYGKINLGTHVSGTLPVTNGGTGASFLSGYVKGNGTSPMSTVSTIPGSDISGNITGSAGNVTGTVAAANGGTGQSSYTVGDLLYASSATALSKLTDAGTGNALISGGAGVAPSYGKIGLTTHVTGTLPVTNGGTNSLTALSGSTIMVSNGTSIVQGTAGTVATVLHGNASGAPSYSAVSLTNDVTGALPTTNGGTGISSYNAGDMLFALGGSSFSKLAATATGNVLLSAGTASGPLWGKINLSTGTVLTGALSIANGGTGSTTQNFVDLTSGQVISGGKTFTADGSFNSVKIGHGAGNMGENVVVGGTSLNNNTTGTNNTAIGFTTDASVTTGSGNTAVGSNAGAFVTTGSNNTSLGFGACNNVATSTNYTSLGYFSGASWSTANNVVEIGNTGVTKIGGAVSWSIASDKRIKNNIQHDVHGLDFIELLEPVTYNISIDKEREIMGNKKQMPEFEGSRDIEKIKFSGFLAQDVEAAAKSIGYDFSGVDVPKDGNGMYGLKYADFVVPIVKAIQEQQQQIEALKLQNEKQEAENQKLTAELSSLMAALENNGMITGTIPATIQNK